MKGLCEMPPMIAHRAIVCTGGAIRIQGFGSTAPTVCRPSLPCLGTMASAQLPKTVGQCRHMKQVAATCQSCVALGSAQRPNTPVVIQIQSVLRFNTHHLCCTRGRCTCFPTYVAPCSLVCYFSFFCRQRRSAAAVSRCRALSCASTSLRFGAGSLVSAASSSSSTCWPSVQPCSGRKAHTKGKHSIGKHTPKDNTA